MAILERHCASRMKGSSMLTLSERVGPADGRRRAPGGPESMARAGRSARIIAAAIIVAATSAGCAMVGPNLIANGRSDYNRAVTDTDNQQMLMVAINNRYEERGSLLAVTSITANVNFVTDARIEAGIGDSDNYRGNLTPFSGGALYEENPTITYTPVAGAQYIRQLTAPVSIPVMATLAHAVVDPTQIYMTLVSRMNGLYNPDFPISDSDIDPRFERAIQIITDLTRAHRLEWVEDPAGSGRYVIVIDDYAAHFSDQVEELRDLLDLPESDAAQDRIVLPTSIASEGREPGGIGITTRSVYRLVELMAANVEVPAADQSAGVVVDYPPTGPAAKGLRVRYATQKPEGAYVAVDYRDGWFYIDDSDIATKRYFRILGSLWAVAIHESASKTAAPVLTVPVSR
jgi:hypothetical protein